MSIIKRSTGLAWMRGHSRVEHHKADNVLKSESDRIEHLENAIALDKAIVVLMKIK